MARSAIPLFDRVKLCVLFSGAQPVGEEEAARAEKKRCREETDAPAGVDMGKEAQNSGQNKRPQRTINGGAGHRLGLDARRRPSERQEGESHTMYDDPNLVFSGDVIDVQADTITRGPAWRAYQQGLRTGGHAGVQRKRRTSSNKYRRKGRVPDVQPRPKTGSSFRMVENKLELKVPGSGWIPLQEASVVDMIHVSAVENLVINPEGEGDVHKYREMMDNAAKAHFARSI